MWTACEDGQRGDQTRAGGVEGLRPVLEPADDEGESEHQHAVRDHGTDQRRLNDERQPLMQGEQRDEELGEIAQRRLDRAGRRGSDSAAELLRRSADEPGEHRDGKRRKDEGHHRLRVGEVCGRSHCHECSCDADLDDVPPRHVPIIGP
jgi:hypothetical protein